MRKYILLVILFSTVTFTLSSQNDNFIEYSYSELFKMIEEEQDSVFMLENAIIVSDVEPNYDFLIEVDRKDTSKYQRSTNPRIVSKAIKLTNVHFKNQRHSKDSKLYYAGLENIIFEKEVEFAFTYRLRLSNCVFKDKFWLSATEIRKPAYFDVFDRSHIEIERCLFNKSSLINIIGDKNKENIGVNVNYNNFQSIRSDQAYFSDESISWFFYNISGGSISNNFFDRHNYKNIHFEELDQLIFEKNAFNSGLPSITSIEVEEAWFRKNEFNVPTLLDVNIYSGLSILDYKQFKARTMSHSGYLDYIMSNYGWSEDNNYIALLDEYEQNHLIQNEDYFNLEIDQKSEFYNYFKSKFNTKTANKIYSEIKTLETERIAYEHNLDPTFSTFFKLRINQFLKLFSNYGTEPERAVVVSLYVIVFFAFIYLFFPNSWDSHGRKRIMNRFRFFTKYMNKDAGIHEVYLDEKKEELLESEDFKDYMLKSNKTIPKFFLNAAMPLYKWSVSGTRMSASFLKRVDIMKGTWKDVPTKKRWWKNILLVGGFSLAIIYDLFIKILNALMLSINTFTTLGFGEIPIKGLPRYLAIIQGFIGWFMLTIFSVSLISQLLN